MPQAHQTLRSKQTSFGLRAVALAALLLVTACTKPIETGEISDPFEKENRSTHAFNLALDQKVLKPASGGGENSGRGVFATGVSHFADNLDAPGDVVNNLLQLRLGQAAQNSLRFVVNTTIGLGGVLDPATAMGVAAKPTDFGETLYVWGVGEGHYLELPLLGPSNARDALGKVVDLALDPLAYTVKAPATYALTAAKITDKVNQRARYSDTVDSIYYDSADSYAQGRLLYTQNRRFELGQTSSDDTVIDPYEDPYGQ
jgi:phospholipid-binding lipoprotein MlaA